MRPKRWLDLPHSPTSIPPHQRLREIGHGHGLMGQVNCSSHSS